MGLAAPRQVGSSWARDQTRIPFISRQNLNRQESPWAHALNSGVYCLIDELQKPIIMYLSSDACVTCHILFKG